MLVRTIKGFFSPSRVEVAKSIRNRGFDFHNIPAVNLLAAKNDVFVRFSESKMGDPRYVNMQIFRRGIDHVADIPEYAVSHNTGDSVYINWEKQLSEMELSPMEIESKFKSIFGHNN